MALNERRPDRYTPGDQDTSKWLDEIAEEFAGGIDVKTAQVRAVRAIVGSLEGAQTRETNHILRSVRDQPPLDWVFFRTLPLVVGDERVAIRACTPDDFREFAGEENIRANEEYKIRQDTVSGALWIAEYMEQNNVQSGAVLHW